MTRNRKEAIILDHIQRGIFEVDGDGRIWRIARRKGNQIVPCKRKRAERTTRNGYLRVHFRHGRDVISVVSHRIIYAISTGHLAGDCDVNHRDCDRQNNHPSNLEAISHAQNMSQRGSTLSERDWCAIGAMGISA